MEKGSSEFLTRLPLKTPVHVNTVNGSTHFIGQVIEDFGPDATVTIVARGTPRTEIADGERVTVKVIVKVDEAPKNRVINALNILVKEQQRMSGAHIRSLLLGGPRPYRHKGNPLRVDHGKKWRTFINNNCGYLTREQTKAH
jgi:hypothetical protein